MSNSSSSNDDMMMTNNEINFYICTICHKLVYLTELHLHEWEVWH